MLYMKSVTYLSTVHHLYIITRKKRRIFVVKIRKIREKEKSLDYSFALVKSRLSARGDNQI